MGHQAAEPSAPLRERDAVAGGRDPFGGRTASVGVPFARELPPPPPIASTPRFEHPAEARAPIWSTNSPDGLESAGLQAAPERDARSSENGAAPARRRMSMVATSFAIALMAFYVLQFAVALLAWYDAELRTPGQADAMVAWAVCAALLLPALLLRGRWRALPLVVATVAGAVAPVLLSRDLVGMLGIPDVWVGQALTLHVVFPLCLGIPATIAALATPRRGA